MTLLIILLPSMGLLTSGFSLQARFSKIFNETHQDRLFDLLKPAFNLSTCKTDSFVVYSNLKTLIVELVSNTIHRQPFSVLIPVYSMEPQTVLDHIWQSYFNKNGVTI
jgi:hypothetical protein